MKLLPLTSIFPHHFCDARAGALWTMFPLVSCCLLGYARRVHQMEPTCWKREVWVVPSCLLPIGFLFLWLAEACFFTPEAALPFCGGCWLKPVSSLSGTTVFLMDHCSILSPPQVQVPALRPSPELRDSITPTRQDHLLEVWVLGPQLPSSELRGLSTSHYLEDRSLVPQGPSTKLPNFNDPNPRSGKCLLWLLLHDASVSSSCFFSSSISGW